VIGYRGCYRDEGNRDLSHRGSPGDGSVRKCIRYCQQEGKQAISASFLTFKM